MANFFHFACGSKNFHIAFSKFINLPFYFIKFPQIKDVLKVTYTAVSPFIFDKIFYFLAFQILMQHSKKRFFAYSTAKEDIIFLLKYKIRISNNIK